MRIVVAIVAGLLCLVIAATVIAVEPWPEDDNIHGTACGGQVGWTAETEEAAETARALYTPEKCEALARGEGRLTE